MTETADSNGGESPLEAAAEERNRFLDLLGREIRTPLNGVVAVAEMLERQPMSPDAQAYVRTIVESSRALLRRLDDAFDLALGDAGRLDVVASPVQLREVVDQVQAEWLARKSGGATLLVSYDGEPDLSVVADATRLKQVFGNLIGHALASTPRGAVEASLRARAAVEGVYIEGRVRDAGPGLAPDRLARIFETGPSEGRSSGLGLALSRRIVEAMRGSIRAESNIGAGVTVVFELLVPRTAEAEVDPMQLDGGGAAHVLVVDDNATNRMVAESLCEMFDCTSETAEDGVGAVEAARSGRFDLILMDIKMPRMDGVEATKAIRAMAGKIGQSPIIALTANADPEDVKTYLAAGMNAVVEKPIKPDKLLAAMNAVLGGSGRSARAA
jgi:CheY-like chemotaxis protein